MKLLHNAYVTNLSPEEIVSEALTNRTFEVDLAVSGYFFSYEDDFEPVWESYDEYYEYIIVELEKVLGIYLYRGNWDTPDFEEWASPLCDTEILADIVIWEKEGVKLYLSHEQEDKELPIRIIMGTEGCKGTGINYPDPLPYTPTHEELEHLENRALRRRNAIGSTFPESKTKDCKMEGCIRGAIPMSNYCYKHHLEIYRQLPTSFGE